MKLLRFGYLNWSGALIVAFVSFLFGKGEAWAAKPGPAPKKAPATRTRSVAKGAVVPRPGVSRPVPPSSVARPDEFADAYPGAAPASADLVLSEESARKAEALASFARGVVAEDMAETEQALEVYRRALALDPGHTDLALRVAYELAKRNDVPAGIQVLKDAAKAAPRDPRPLVYLAQFYAKHLKKPDLALKFAEQAVAIDPAQVAGYLALYELYAGSGQMQKAEEVIDRAEKSKSEDPKFWLQLGDLTTRLYLKEDGSSEPAHIERMNALYRRRYR